MKCCVCGKEVDTAKNPVPPQWYGKYEGWKQTAVICVDCIATPEGKEKWHAPQTVKVESRS